jgi:hypothetical protein
VHMHIYMTHIGTHMNPHILFLGPVRHFAPSMPERVSRQLIVLDVYMLVIVAIYIIISADLFFGGVNHALQMLWPELVVNNKWCWIILHAAAQN